jgi:uncharacterized protein (UPF0333 family)
LHLARALKKLLTILFLLLMATHATGYFHNKPWHETKLVHEADEKQENTSSRESKEAKEYLAPSAATNGGATGKCPFVLYLVGTHFPPAVACLAPPPDAASCVS